MAVNVAVWNAKGGVGKSTVAYNFAAIAARALTPRNAQGKPTTAKVLLVDVDYQGSATGVLLGQEIVFSDRDSGQPTLLDALEGKIKSLSEAIYRVELLEREGCPAAVLDVVPSRFDMIHLDTSLNQPRGLYALKKLLAQVEDVYSLIVVDCPANLGGFVNNALIACPNLVVPVMPGRFELVALNTLMTAVDTLRETGMAPDLKIVAYQPIRMSHNNISRDTLDGLKAQYNGHVLPAITQLQTVQWAQVAQQDVLTHAGAEDKSARQFVAAANELLKILGLRKGGRK